MKGGKNTMIAIFVFLEGGKGEIVNSLDGCLRLGIITQKKKPMFW